MAGLLLGKYIGKGFWKIEQGLAYLLLFYNIYHVLKNIQDFSFSSSTMGITSYHTSLYKCPSPSKFNE